jgi:hypothetical protein
LDTYGEWGVPHQLVSGLPVGKQGPAARDLGYGWDGYAQLIRGIEKEEGWDVFARYVDPRAGVTKTKAEEVSTDLITEFSARGLYFEQAPGLNILHGLKAINQRLSWNKDEQFDKKNNSPTVYIHRRCGNLIMAMGAYTNCHKREIWKDPVDCLRMLTEVGPYYVAPDDLYGDDGGGWGGYGSR